MSLLAVVPARGGSKSLPGKNIKQFAGRPLIQWTIDAARQARHVDEVVVSTDDAGIADVSVSCGAKVPFLRPTSLAQDDTPTVDVILHALDQLPEYSEVVCLQPTSPLRISEDVDGAIEECRALGGKSIASVTEADKHPNWMFQRDTNGKLVPIFEGAELALRRQDLEKVYALNGAIYFADAGWLQHCRSLICSSTLAYVMPRERSFDIDDQMDWIMAESLIRECNG